MQRDKPLGCQYKPQVHLRDRTHLIRHQDVPMLMTDGTSVFWNGTHAIRRGRILARFVPRLNRQMLRLMQDHFYCDLDHIFINDSAWWHIRECIDGFDCMRRQRIGECQCQPFIVPFPDNVAEDTARIQAEAIAFLTERSIAANGYWHSLSISSKDIALNIDRPVYDVEMALFASEHALHAGRGWILYRKPADFQEEIKTQL